MAAGRARVPAQKQTAFTGPFMYSYSADLILSHRNFEPRLKEPATRLIRHPCVRDSALLITFSGATLLPLCDIQSSRSELRHEHMMQVYISPSAARSFFLPAYWEVSCFFFFFFFFPSTLLFRSLCR